MKNESSKQGLPDQKAYTPRRSGKLNRYSTGEDVLRKYSKHRSGRPTGSIEEDLRVEGFYNKTCIITGGSSGLGLETVKMMLLGGARKIYVCCRNTLAAAAALRLGTTTENRVAIVELDLLSIRSIKYCADEILEREVESTIDIVICNAGTIQAKYLLNENGWEYHMATNYIGHFYLVNLLLPKMRAQETSSRIIMISSRYHTNARLNINDMHFSGRSSSTPSSGTSSSSSSSGMFSHWNRFCPRTAYANSKLATILFARALALRLEDTNVVAVALHPGRVSTSLRKNFAPEEGVRSLIFKTFVAEKSIAQGVSTAIYVCIAPEITRMSGSYFEDCARADDALSEDAQDPTGMLREMLWRETRLQIKKEILKMAMAELESLPPPPPPPPPSDGSSTSTSSASLPTYSVTFILPEHPAEETAPAEDYIENASEDDNLLIDGS